MLDRRVDLRQLRLKVCRTCVELANEDGQLTEDVCVDDGSEEQADTCNGNLERATRPAVVARGQEHRGMERHEVLVVDGLLVDVVPVLVVEVHRRNPLLLGRDNHPPDAAEAMQIDDEEEDEFVELEEGFEFLCRPQIRDDFAQTEHSHKFERAKNLERRILTAEEPLANRVKRQRCKDVNRELAAQVVPANHLHVSDFGACALIDVRRPETDDDVDQEKCVDDEVEELEDEGLERLWVEAHVQRDHEHVERGQKHHEKIPLGLAWVVDAQQARCFGLLEPLRGQKVVNVVLVIRSTLAAHVATFHAHGSPDKLALIIFKHPVLLVERLQQLFLLDVELVLIIAILLLEFAAVLIFALRCVRIQPPVVVCFLQDLLAALSVRKVELFICVELSDDLFVLLISLLLLQMQSFVDVRCTLHVKLTPLPLFLS